MNDNTYTRVSTTVFDSGRIPSKGEDDSWVLSRPNTTVLTHSHMISFIVKFYVTKDIFTGLNIGVNICTCIFSIEKPPALL